jgi:hypothetical protein
MNPHKPDSLPRHPLYGKARASASHSLAHSVTMTALSLASPRPTFGPSAAAPAAARRRASVSCRRVAPHSHRTPRLGRTKASNNSDHEKSKASFNSFPFPSTTMRAMTPSRPCNHLAAHV